MMKCFVIFLTICIFSDGNPTFKPQLINDIRITLLPALIEQIKYIPLPQILYADKQYDIALENLVFEGDTLMPDIFEIRVSTMRVVLITDF